MLAAVYRECSLYTNIYIYVLYIYVYIQLLIYIYDIFCINTYFFIFIKEELTIKYNKYISSGVYKPVTQLKLHKILK